MNMQDKGWPPLQACRFFRDQRQVVLEVDGRCHRMRYKRGWAYILALVGHQGLPARAGQLEELYEMSAPGRQTEFAKEEAGNADLHPGEAYLGQPVCDWQTVADIKCRLIVLLEELALAEEFHNDARVDELRDERDQLLQYLQEACGLGGRLRCFPTEERKRRARVAQAISRCLDEMAGLEPELAKYLRLCLVLGEWFVYHPRGLEIVIGED